MTAGESRCADFHCFFLQHAADGPTWVKLMFGFGRWCAIEVHGSCINLGKSTTTEACSCDETHPYTNKQVFLLL
jgi:hypothetical protein